MWAFGKKIYRICTTGAATHCIANLTNFLRHLRRPVRILQAPTDTHYPPPPQLSKSPFGRALRAKKSSNQCEQLFSNNTWRAVVGAGQHLHRHELRVLGHSVRAACRQASDLRAMAETVFAARLVERIIRESRIAMKRAASVTAITESELLVALPYSLQTRENSQWGNGDKESELTRLIVALDIEIDPCCTGWRRFVFWSFLCFIEVNFDTIGDLENCIPWIVIQMLLNLSVVQALQ